VLIARDRQDLLMRNNIVGAVFNVGANVAAITLIGIDGAAAVRVATYALMLALNHGTCVSRGLAPSLSVVLARGTPRASPGRSSA
jgi:O-antigen/teichoic acid export membrane protein